MSHHFDVSPPNWDVSDVHCFAGPSDDDGPRTVIGMNTSPAGGDPWDTTAFYELKLDLDNDLIEDITWRFTFTNDSAGNPQYVQIAQLDGPHATSRTAPGTIITPPNSPVDEVLYLANGIKAFAGLRLDSFFTDVDVPEAVRNVLPPIPPSTDANPGLNTLPRPFTDYPFAGQNVRLVMVELPACITGLDPIQCWGSTAVLENNVWTQVQRAAGPDTSVVFQNGNDPYHGIINSTGPSVDLVGRPADPYDPNAGSGVWRAVRDQVTTVVTQLKNWDQGVNGRPTPIGYGVWVADTLLPNVLRFTPGTFALWDPWNGILNGKGLYEELASAFARMIVNSDFSTHLRQSEALTPYFPYLAPPSADS